MSAVVEKLWGFCHKLKHDGIAYTEYIEQLSFLLFLKLADEKGIEVPDGCDWPTLKALSGPDLIDGYDEIIKKLRTSGGFIGSMFANGRSLFTKAVTLKELIRLIDEDSWAEMDADIKGDAYEGLLAKAASEGKKGAGQYFTPRPLIRSIVRCVKPNPLATDDFTICDPACGTGGFLLLAYEWFLAETGGGAIPREHARRINRATYHGQDVSVTPRRLGLMNLYLHGLQPNIQRADSIYDPPMSARYNVILTNPPFGVKGAGEVPTRDDFTVETSNKQLNFLQHILKVLKPGGRAAVVVPDDCLFRGQAGDVMKILMEDCNVHTLLRLPDGTFAPYTGTMANVIFFQKGPATERLWIYDNRTNVPKVTKKARPLTVEHFVDFVECFGTDPNGRSPRIDQGEEGRWRSFTTEAIKARGYNLDIKWLRDDSVVSADDLGEPSDIAAEILSLLETATEEIEALADLLNGEDAGTGASA